MTDTLSPTRLPRMRDRDAAGDAMLASLAAMVPDLRARAGQAEAEGRIPQSTVEALQQAGVFRAVVPRRYGGLELPYPYVPQIFRLLGRGCSSTSWSMGFLCYHNFQFGHFPLAAQDEVWGGRGYTMAPGQVMPSGSAREVEGGYEIEGRWGYATGINHGDWMLVSSPTQMASGAKVMRRFYIPVSAFTVLDTWDVVAMKATGSHDVTLPKTFVPAHRSIAVDDMRNIRAEGLQHNAGPLWRIPLLSYMVLACAGPMVGAAEALLEIVADVMKVKVGAYSGDKQQGLMTQQLRIARLSMDLDATIRLWEGHIDDLWNQVKAGEDVSRERRAEIRAVTAHVVKRCHEIVTELAGSVGSRSYYADSPIQRFHRDMASLSTHALFDYDQLASLYGATRLGLDLPAHAMI